MAVDTLKETITTAPCLHILGDEGQFRVEADALEGAVRAVLLQQLEDKWHPVLKECVFCRWNKGSWSGESMGCRGGMGLRLVWGLGSFTGTLKRSEQ